MDDAGQSASDLVEELFGKDEPTDSTPEEGGALSELLKGDLPGGDPTVSPADTWLPGGGGSGRFDPPGFDPEEYNRRMAEERAEAVAEGIDEGSAAIIYPDHDPEGRIN